MKVNLRSFSALLLAATTAFTACKKSENTSSGTDLATEVQTHADDQSRVSGGLDDANNDADVAMESNATFTGREQNVLGNICNATAVADTVSNPRTITITYNGNDCNNTTFRTGKIILAMAAGTRWKNAGAVITATFQNYKVKRLSDNKSVTLNGTQTITNVNGGLLYQLSANSGGIVHTITSNNMSITFDDGTQRTWSISRKREFNYDNGIKMSVRGTGTVGTATNVAEWGTNRFGHAFSTAITAPVVIRQDCAFRITSGEIKHDGVATSTVTFGLNASGQPTTCPGTGNYFMKIVWTGPNGASVTAILPY